MRLKFEFGKEFELKRVKRTLAKLDWYNSQGYTPRLPEEITKESSEEEIGSQVEKEYEKEKYEKIEEKISSDFSKIEESLSNKLREIFNKEISKEFIIYLTNYGVGGSYNLPNMVVLNINNKKGFKTIIHEIIHLVIQERIIKYEIQHWEKERIVDLILNSKEFNFLDYSSWQKNYRNTEDYIDNLFERFFFKDSEKFFSKIKDIRRT